MKRAVFLWLILLSEGASASKWATVWTGADGSKTEIEWASAKATDVGFAAWVRTSGGNALAKLKILSATIKEDFDCVNGRQAWLGGTLRYADGTTEPIPPRGWRPIEPDTMDEVLMKTVCR